VGISLLFTVEKTMTHRLALLLSDLDESFFFAAVLEGGGVVPVVAFDTDSVVLEREDPRVVDELMSFKRSKEKKTRSQGAKSTFYQIANCPSCLCVRNLKSFFLWLFHLCVTDKFQLACLAALSHLNHRPTKYTNHYTDLPISIKHLRSSDKDLIKLLNAIECLPEALNKAISRPVVRPWRPIISVQGRYLS
jgi:hypothetical protein